MKKPKLTKTKEEIEIMKKSGRICSEALKEVLKNVKPQVSCNQLDMIAEKEIQKRGASPSFKSVDNYNWTICTTVNEQVVHGIPNERKLAEGDVLGIDIGALYENYHSDLAISIPVGQVSAEKVKFLKIGKQTLENAIREAKINNRIGDISHTIQESIEKNGYSIVKSLTGHGVGRELHEEPLVPGFGEKRSGPIIEENMVLAIEVIYASGSGAVVVEDDGWTISTADGSLGGLFEKTIAVTKNGPIVLTPYL